MLCSALPIVLYINTLKNRQNIIKNSDRIKENDFLKFQVQVSHLLKFIGYLVFVGYLAAKDSSDSSFNKHSRGVA